MRTLVGFLLLAVAPVTLPAQVPVSPDCLPSEESAGTCRRGTPDTVRVRVDTVYVEGTKAKAAPIPVAPKPVSGHPQTRQGFWFNVGLGYGSLGCDNCNGREGGLSGGLSLGGTLSQKFLLGVGTTGWTRSEGGTTLTVGTLDLRFRFYPSATGGFFLTGGLGVGSIHAEVNGFGSDTETGGAAVVGLGYDARVGSNVSLTPFLNGFAVRSSNADANVGQIGLSVTIH